MLEEITITIIKDSGGSWQYDIYEGLPDMSISLESEDATLTEIDGGCCTTNLKNTLGMVYEVIKENK